MRRHRTNRLVLVLGLLALSCGQEPPPLAAGLPEPALLPETSGPLADPPALDQVAAPEDLEEPVPEPVAPPAAEPDPAPVPQAEASLEPPPAPLVTAPTAEVFAAPRPQLLITEIMANPKAAADAKGEWIEILNQGAAPAALKGLTVSDCGGRSFRIETEAVLEAGKRLVIGAADRGRENGGAPVDLRWQRLSLSNEQGCVRLLIDGTELDSVTWDGRWSVPNGASAQLDPLAEERGDNDDPAKWCRSTKYADTEDGDRGTPGEENTPCGRKNLVKVKKEKPGVKQ